MTKKQEAILRAYNYSHKTTLHECYGSWSWAKEHAYNYCKRLCEEMNGYGFKIIGYNTCMFSVGFIYYKGDKKMFHYETNATTLDFEIIEA